MSTPAPSPHADSRVHALWNALADFPASEAVAARTHLLRELCVLLEADNAVWCAVLRLNMDAATDPLRGWRVRNLHFLHDQVGFDAARREWLQRMERGSPSARMGFSETGTFRVRRLCDVTTPAFFEGEFYQRLYRKELGIHDGMWLGMPVNDDAEVGIVLLRGAGRDWFGTGDCARAADIVRGLRWFHRQQLLAQGLLVADTPLTPVEQRVLQGLLAGRTDKQIACHAGQSPHTTSEYVRRLYRKFGVAGRAELMSLWLGR